MMMRIVLILPLVVLLSERAPTARCGPASGIGALSNNTIGGAVWGRSFGVLPEHDRFYTLEHGTTTWRPRPRSPKASNTHREPRFLAFETKDNHVEVEVNFAIPFISIPIRNALEGMMGTLAKGTPLLHVNLGALVMAGMLTVGGALFGAVSRSFSNSSLQSDWNMHLGREPHMQRPESRRSQDERENSEHASYMQTLLGLLDRTMGRFDIDTVACAQRTVCWYVKEATAAVAEGRPSSMDTVIEGLSRADWLGKFMAGSGFEQAIQTGRQQTNCEISFSGCTITDIVEKLVRAKGG